jgi:hypothetical protein
MVTGAKPNRMSNFRLLTNWVNIQDSRVLLTRHSKLPRSLSEDDVTEIRWALQRAWESEDFRAREWHLFVARWLYVRATETRANFTAFLGQRFADYLIPAVPVNDQFHQAIADLQGAIPRMAKCRWCQIAQALGREQLQKSTGREPVSGIPWCQEPFYIRRDTKRKQPYCSKPCHGNFLRLAKQRNGLRISELNLK